MMREIYKKARAVIMWLGNEVDQSGLAMELLSMIYRAAPKASVASDDNQKPADTAVVENFFRDDDYAMHWKALLCLFQRQYWNRLWIVQEIASNKNPYVLCGSQLESFFTILYVLEGLQTFSTSESTGAISIARPQVMYIRKWPNVQRAWIDPDAEGLPLLRALVLARQYQASMSVDYAFAILGLTSPEDVYVKPDYTSSAKRVFMNITVNLISHHESLDVLTACKEVPVNHLRSDFERNDSKNVWRLASGFFVTGITTLSDTENVGEVLRSLHQTEVVSHWTWPNVFESSSLGSYLLVDDPVEKVVGIFIPENEYDFLYNCLLQNPFLLEQVVKNKERWSSWTPDWSKSLTHGTHLPYLLLNSSNPIFYQASNCTTPDVVFNEDESSLTVSGVIFDKVLSVAPLVFNLEQHDQVYGWFNRSSDLPNPYGTLPRRLSAFRNACVLGRDNNGLEWDVDEDKKFRFLWSIFHKCHDTDGKTPEFNVKRDEISPIIARMSYGSQFFLTSRGYVGRGPWNLDQGDEVALLFGGKVPFLLREAVQGQYVLLGEVCKCTLSMNGSGLR